MKIGNTIAYKLSEFNFQVILSKRLPKKFHLLTKVKSKSISNLLRIDI